MDQVTPVQLTLYDENDDIYKELSRSRIPWGTLKAAVSLAKGVDPDATTTEDMDRIAQFVCDFFGEAVTLEEINNYADLNDMIAVIQNIMARASSLVKANPTVPSGAKPKRPK